MKLKLVSLFPNHLNLNGDQANLMIMQKRLEWYGHASEIVTVEKSQSIPVDASMIFLGHGSMAAWSAIEEDLFRLIPEIQNLKSAGVALMAVASGHEWAIQNGIFDGVILKRDRVSKFEIVELHGQEVLGYLNSASDAPVIQKSGLLLGTQLHGPLFAKNPLLVDSYLAEILNFNQVPLENQQKFSEDSSALTSQQKRNQISQIVDQVWVLERELARED
jgi:CobQ-like glutamine amidotransferase family enzyme